MVQVRKPADAHGKYQEDLAIDYRIGKWHVSPSRNRLTAAGSSRSVEPKVMLVLKVLMENQGTVLSRSEIEDTVWPNSVIGEKTLTRAISELRKALGDDAENPTIIETIPRRGYRLSAQAVRTDRKLWSRRKSFFAAIVASGLLTIAVVIGSGPSRIQSVEPSRQLTSEPGHELNPSPSPAGDLVVFAKIPRGESSTSLFIKQINGEDDLRLTFAAENDISPRWSPDGGQIVFMRFNENSCKILTVGALGGKTQLVTDCSLHPVRANFAPTLDWSANGTQIAFVDLVSGRDCRNINLIDVQSGERTPLIEPLPSLCHNDIDPIFSPDGESIVFTRMFQRGIGDLFVLDLKQRSLKRLTEDYVSQLGATWVAPDSIIFSSNRSGTYRLWRVDVGSGEIKWIPTDGLNVKRPSVNSSGILAYENWQYDMNIWVSTKGDAAPRQLIASTVWDFHPGLAPDGKRVAFVSNRSGNFELWLYDETGDYRQLSRTPNRVVGYPAWSPDGQNIAYVVQEKNRLKIWITSPGGGSTREIETTANATAPTWSTSGEHIIFGSDESGTWQVWEHNLASGERRRITEEGGYRGVVDNQGNLYFTRKGQNGLWRSTSGGEEMSFVSDLPMVSWADWNIYGDNLIYPTENAGEFRIVSTADDNDQQTVSTPAIRSANAQSIQVTADLGKTLWVQLDDTEADVFVSKIGSSE